MKKNDDDPVLFLTKSKQVGSTFLLTSKMVFCKKGKDLVVKKTGVLFVVNCDEG